MDHNDVRGLVSALCDGDENAFHTLIEAHHDVVPTLIEQFTIANDGQCRAKIVEVIWKHRIPSTLSFLVSALDDKHPAVWKQAVDGLVALGGAQSANALSHCLNRVSQDDQRFLWIAEAIDQIRSQTL